MRLFMSKAASTAIRSPSSKVKAPPPVGLKNTMRSASPSMLTHLQEVCTQNSMPSQLKRRLTCEGTLCLPMPDRGRIME